LYSIYRIKIILSIILAIILLLSGCSVQKKTEFKDPHFIQYNSSFSAELGSSYTIDLAYFLEKDSEDMINPEKILYITFKDSKNLKVNNFRFINSRPSKLYEIKNIILEVEFIDIGNERINELEIRFNDNSIKTYPIGDWNFSVHPEQDNKVKYLEMGSKYPIVGSVFQGYAMSFINNSSTNLTITDVEINLDGVIFNKEKITIRSLEEYNDLLKPRKFNDDNKFFIVRPKITYEVNQETYNYYPFAQLYGLINMTDEDINNEAAKTMTILNP
jgi:hypothetical protein